MAETGRTSVVLMRCGHWKRSDATTGALYAFCAHCDRYVDVMEDMHGKAPDRRPWFYRWERGNRVLPWLGGDEWCRRTAVLTLPLVGSAVFPLWTCRGCEACDQTCAVRP